LAISKSDVLDEELTEEMKKELPEMPYVFISSVAQKGLMELKDLLWKAIGG
jgi:GTP-binding protein